MSQNDCHTAPLRVVGQFVLHHGQSRQNITEEKSQGGRQYNLNLFLLVGIQWLDIISKVGFRWMNKLLGEGYKKELGIEDLYEVRQEDRSTVVGDNLERFVVMFTVLQSLLKVQFRSWLSEIKTEEKSREETASKPRLGIAILKTFGWSYISLGFFTFLEECVIRVYQPIFMGKSVFKNPCVYNMLIIV